LTAVQITQPNSNRNTVDVATVSGPKEFKDLTRALISSRPILTTFYQSC